MNNIDGAEEERNAIVNNEKERVRLELQKNTYDDMIQKFKSSKPSDIQTEINAISLKKVELLQQVEFFDAQLHALVYVKNNLGVIK